MKYLTVLSSIALSAFAFTAHAATREAGSTIVIDAGHGGFDRGGVPGQQISEKDKTLDVALRLRQILRAAGYRVVMTREGDYFVTLGNRVAIANSYRGAQFVSIHFNCAPRAGANGIETYYYRSDSAALATRIHRNVVAGAPSENRGIRRRGFYVIRKTAIPAVLVECGFLTNPTEGRLASSAQYRQQLAQEIANGIMGGPTPAARPINPGSAISSEVLPQEIAGEDFVRAGPHSARASKHSRSSKVTKATKKTKKKLKREET
ncbi:MAG: N-acetylmuramoyl-L-alanine amidase [Chthoniobacterales bacterium]